MLSMNSSATTGGQWIPVGSVDQIGLGQGSCFMIGTLRIAVFRLRSGKILALDAVCPHRGGPLAEGIVGCETVICPLHGYTFSLTDGRGLDSDFSVRTYATEIRDGGVFVRLPA